MRKPHHRWLVVIPFVMLLTVGGCKSLAKMAPDVPDISQRRKENAAAASSRLQQDRNHAQVLAARSLWQHGDVEGCHQTLLEVLDRRPDDPEALALLAEVTSASPPNRARTSAAHVSSLHQSPDAEASSAVTRNTLTFHPGPTDRSSPSTIADAHVRPATYSAPTTLLDQAAVALVAGDTPQAQQLLRTVLEQHPRDVELANSVAVLPLRYDQPDLTVELAEVALARLGLSVGLCRALGTAHYRRGDFPAAQRVLQHALSVDNADPLTYFLMGHTLDKLGDHAGAAWHLGEARRLDAHSLLSR